MCGQAESMAVAMKPKSEIMYSAELGAANSERDVAACSVRFAECV
jgi:hypothetical protein